MAKSFNTGATNMKRALLLPLAFLALSSRAAAPAGGVWKDAKITDITVYTAAGPAGKGYVVVTFSSNGSNAPNCASGYPKSVVIDLSNASGAFAASVLQASRLIGGTITVTGTGTCSVNPTMETLASVQE
jgi:hypothetical protein